MSSDTGVRMDDNANLVVANLEYTPNGIQYEWGLAGPEGAWFDLKPVRGKHSAEDVKAAKAHLRNSQDVVRLKVIWQVGP